MIIIKGICQQMATVVAIKHKTDNHVVEALKNRLITAFTTTMLMPLGIANIWIL